MLFLIHLVMETRKTTTSLIYERLQIVWQQILSRGRKHTLCRLLNFSWRIFIQPSVVTLHKNLTNLVNTVCSCLRDLLGTRSLSTLWKFFSFRDISVVSQKRLTAAESKPAIETTETVYHYTNCCSGPSSSKAD